MSKYDDIREEILQPDIRGNGFNKLAEGVRHFWDDTLKRMRLIGYNSSGAVRAEFIDGGIPGDYLTSGTVTSTQIAASVAGDGLVGGGGSPLAVNPDGSTLEIASDQVKVKASGITATQIATSVAGSGLAGGGGTALSVNVDGTTLTIGADTLQVPDGGIGAAQIAAAVAGNGLTGGAGSALAVGAGSGITVNANDVTLAEHDHTFHTNQGRRQAVWGPEIGLFSGAPDYARRGTNERYRAWAFDAAANEAVIFEWTPPVDYVAATAVTFKLIWTNLGAGAGNVVWRLFVSSVAETGDMNSVASEANASDTVAAPAQNVLKITNHSRTVTPAASDIVRVLVQRVAADAGDTLANDAGLLGVWVDYTANM